MNFAKWTFSLHKHNLTVISPIKNISKISLFLYGFILDF